MSTSIRISEQTKRKLEALKGDEETFDQLLDRLARTEKDVEELAGFADEPVEEAMDQARQELNDGLQERTEQKK
jgi:predicted CopG family antitoxin